MATRQMRILNVTKFIRKAVRIDFSPYTWSF